MAGHGEARQRRSRERWVAVVGLVVALLLVPIVWLVMPRAFFGETLPSPNGYDDLVAASRAVTGDFREVTDLKKADTEEMRALVEGNREALARARVGLGRESVVAMARSPSVEAHLKDFGALRALGRLLACEAALAEREGRTAEAAGRYAGVIRFGRAMSFGGILPDRTAEVQVQYAGVEGLDRLAPELPADDARWLAEDVERLDRDREPLTRVFDRDLAFNLARGGVPSRVAYAINYKTMQGLLAPAKVATEQADRRGQARLRLLAVTLALRAYRLDHLDAPVPPALDALVPAYLKAVPADPFGEGPLKLKVQGNAERVYSVGPDGRDDGGTAPSSRNSAVGDLLLGEP